MLNVCRALRDVLQRVSSKLYLVLYVLRRLHIHAWLHRNSSNDLLANEVTVNVIRVSISLSCRSEAVQSAVPDINLVQPSLGVLFNVDIDRKMCIDIAHLVLEAPGHSDDKVVDDGFNGPQRCHVLACAMVQLNVDDVLRRVGE